MLTQSVDFLFFQLLLYLLTFKRANCINQTANASKYLNVQFHVGYWVIEASIDGPIRRDITLLTTNENAELVVFYRRQETRSCSKHKIYGWIYDGHASCSQISQRNWHACCDNCLENGRAPVRAVGRGTKISYISAEVRFFLQFGIGWTRSRILWTRESCELVQFIPNCTQNHLIWY